MPLIKLHELQFLHGFNDLGETRNAIIQLLPVLTQAVTNNALPNNPIQYLRLASNIWRCFTPTFGPVKGLVRARMVGAGAAQAQPISLNTFNQYWAGILDLTRTNNRSLNLGITINQVHLSF